MSAPQTVYYSQTPEALDSLRLEHFCSFIEEYGGVVPGRVCANLKRAFLIAWAEQGSTLIGISCLKNPRLEYLKNLCHRMELPLAGFLERGYTCVHPAYSGEGVASRLVGMLQKAAGKRPYYALAHEDNPAIQAILRQSGEVKLRSFYSDLADRKLGLWVSPAGVEKLNTRP